MNITEDIVQTKDYNYMENENKKEKKHFNKRSLQVILNSKIEISQ